MWTIRASTASVLPIQNQKEKGALEQRPSTSVPWPAHGRAPRMCETFTA